MKLYRVVLAALFTFLFLLPGVVFAQTNFRGGELVTLPQGEIINDNYFSTGNNVTVSGTVNGDVYVAGGNVTVDGNVNGDILAAGGNLNLRGVVTGDIRAAGGQITISGTVGRNITAVGGQIVILNDARVAGSLTAAGGDITVQAPVGKGIQAAGGQLTLASTVPGAVTFAGGQLYLSPTANVAGNITYYSDNEASIQAGATVSGQVQRQPLPQVQRPSPETPEQILFALSGIWLLMSFISSLLYGIALTLLLPRFVHRTTESMGDRFWVNLGIGALALLIIPAILFVLLITVVGVPLAFILLMVFIILLYSTRVFVSLFLGRWIFSRFGSVRHPVLSLALGLVVYYLIGLVPILGGLAQFLLNLTALGALLKTSRASMVPAAAPAPVTHPHPSPARSR